MPFGSHTGPAASEERRSALGVCRPLSHYANELISPATQNPFTAADAAVPPLSFLSSTAAGGGLSFPYGTTFLAPPLSYRESVLSRLHDERRNPHRAAGHSSPVPPAAETAPLVSVPAQPPLGFEREPAASAAAAAASAARRPTSAWAPRPFPPAARALYAPPRHADPHALCRARAAAVPVDSARHPRHRQETELWALVDRLALRQGQRRAAPHTASGTYRFYRSAGPRRASAEQDFMPVGLVDPLTALAALPVPPPRVMETPRGARGLDDVYALEAALAPDVDDMSYEELLLLADRIGRVTRGVPLERLRQLRVVLQKTHFDGLSPVVKRKREAPPVQGAPSRADAEGQIYKRTESVESEEPPLLSCCVCLDGFCVGDAAMQLPCCLHFLHEGCAEKWFESHFRCPICTQDVRSTN